MRSANPSHSCPSDLAIDRLIAGELDASAAEAIEKHAGGCDTCKALIAERRLFAERLGGAAPVRSAQILAAHEAARAVASHRSGARSPALRTFAWGIGVAAVVLVSSIAVFRAIDPAPPIDHVPIDRVRVKGGFSLSGYVKRDGSISRIESGETFYESDELRFSYTTDCPGYLALIGIDAADVITFYAPHEPGKAMRVDAASDKALSESTVLDATSGLEVIVGFLCEQLFAPKDMAILLVEHAGALRDGELPRALAPESDCALARFTLRKRERTAK